MVGRTLCLVALCFVAPLDDAALIADLENASRDEYALVLEEVFAVFDEHSRAHEFDTAIALANAMRTNAENRGAEYLRTRVWASSTLGLTQTRAGRHAEAEETVSREIDFLRAELARLAAELAASETPDQALRDWRAALQFDLVGLYDRRALARLGAGRPGDALSDLGASLAGGSRDAALVLGRLALREGELKRARRLFGSLLSEDGGEAWARRGWGLSMLP